MTSLTRLTQSTLGVTERMGTHTMHNVSSTTVLILIIPEERYALAIYVDIAVVGMPPAPSSLHHLLAWCSPLVRKNWDPHCLYLFVHRFDDIHLCATIKLEVNLKTSL